jgi:hypothetical protein
MKRVRKKQGGKRRKAGLSWTELCEAAAQLPGVEEGTSYGTPSLRVRKKLLARLREGGEDIVLPVDLLDRDALLQSDPDVFHVTDHYRAYPLVLLRISKGSIAAAMELIEDAWQRAAPRRLQAELTTPAKPKPRKSPTPKVARSPRGPRTRT